MPACCASLQSTFYGIFDMAVLLWLEGVDFDATLEDTNHLSVLRGGSLTLLAAASEAEWYLSHEKLVKVQRVFDGASLALFRLDCDEPAGEKLAESLLDYLHHTGESPEGIRRHARRARDPAQLLPPFAHMRFVAGVAEDSADASGPHLAQARARLMQMQGRAPRRASKPGMQNCAFSGHKVGDTTLSLRPDHAEKYGVSGRRDGDSVEVSVSRAAAARWYYGRAQRQMFYRDTKIVGSDVGKLVPAEHSFVDNLQDMIDLDWCEAAKTLHAALPMAVRGKIAVFYADGNKFSAIRNAMGGTSDALKLFSDTAAPLMQKAIAALLGAVAQGATEPEGTTANLASVFFDENEKTAESGVHQRQIRFETLLYGGDEICFVAPAWFGLAMAACFFRAVTGQKLTDAKGTAHDLTFKVGLVFAPVKMPIAVSRGLAKDLAEATADLARAADLSAGLDKSIAGVRNIFGVHAFESVEPPANGLSNFRKGLFGANLHGASDLLALDGDAFADSLDDMIDLSAPSAIPRSQLFRMLRAAQWMNKDGKKLAQPNVLGCAEANAASAKEFENYKRRAGQTFAPAMRGNFWVDELAKPEHSAVAAWILTHLWDYIDPVSRSQSGLIQADMAEV